MGKPPYPGPSDYLILSLVTMIMCGALNITSLLIGIPGLVFSGLVSAFVVNAHVHTIIVLKSHSYAFNTICTNLVTFIIIIILPMTYYYIQSNHHCRVNKNYHKVKRYSNYALGLAIANIMYTFLLCIILIGVGVGVSKITLHGYGCNFCRYLPKEHAWKLNTYKDRNYALHAC